MARQAQGDDDQEQRGRQDDPERLVWEVGLGGHSRTPILRTQTGLVIQRTVLSKVTKKGIKKHYDTSEYQQKMFYLQFSIIITTIFIIID